MDELLKAITNLINTGGALADDALYLYFGLQIIAYAVVPLSIMATFRGIVAWVRTYQEKELEITHDRIKISLLDYWAKNPSSFGRDPWHRESTRQNQIAAELAAEARTR